MTKDYIIGMWHPSGLLGEVEKPCSKCKQQTFFSDIWDWEKYEPLCLDCVMKQKKKKFELKLQTIQHMKKLGFTDQEIQARFEYISRRLNEKTS